MVVIFCRLLHLLVMDFKYFLHLIAMDMHNPCLSPKVPKMKIVEFADSVHTDEAAHYELPHLDLQCLPSDIGIINMI